ncbi:MAG: hypothetical protein IT385_12185 [Deltaproteobacteria bacterium]|nr:hypothetical protein [Deltaproteobacteria bacterium]
MMSAAITALVALVVQAPPAPRHVLVLDDSGSMEVRYDPHGYGLATPALLHDVLGDALSVLLLAQGSPRGPVPELGAGDFLVYPRENGTSYERAIGQAITRATDALRAEPARPVEIVLVTDAEPSDAAASAAIDRALAADSGLTFRCVLLGTRDEGDLCRGRATAVGDGFEMAQALATGLAKSLGSVPQWGRLGPRQTTATIPLGRFVGRAHVMLLGARAGEDFAVEVSTSKGRTPITTRYTRPLMPADLLQIQSISQGLGVPTSLPVGPSPRLALGAITVEGGVGDVTLHLTRSDGEVAWGVLLEHELALGITAPASVEAPGTIAVRVHLVHDGAHIADVATLTTLGLAASLVATPACDGPCAPDRAAARTLPLTLGPDGWAEARVPAEDGIARWDFEARMTSATMDLRSPVASTTITRAAAAIGTPLPGTPPPIPPATPPEPAATPATPPEPPVATPPATPPPVAAAPTIARWIPPVLDLPDFQIEGGDIGYALTVTSSEGKALTGVEIHAEGLTAALVVDGRELPMALVGDRFEARFPVGAVGAREVSIRLATPSGPLSSNVDRMEVLPDARVRLPPRTDVGEVEAGCGATDRCVPIDLQGSTRLDGVALAATRRAGTWPEARVTLRRGEATWTLVRDEATTIDPGPDSGIGPLELCVAPPGCTDVAPDAHELVDVGPADPRLATSDRTARTRVVATVEPSSWLACNLWWVILVGTGLLLLFLVYGWIRPRAFPSGAVVHVADQERRLARDPGRPLRAVPHGRRGFYRTATCAFDGSGYTVKKTRPHVVMLRAEGGSQIALVPRGAQVARRARGAWVPVDRAAERFVLPGATYRINGSFFFRVLA